MKPTTSKAAAPDAAPDFTGDEHWGIGGRYIVVDGKRIPAPPEADTAAAPSAQLPAEQLTIKDTSNG